MTLRRLWFVLVASVLVASLAPAGVVRADGDGTFAESYRATLPGGGVVSEGVGLWSGEEPGSGSIALAGVPGDAVVEAAFLYWSTLGVADADVSFGSDPDDGPAWTQAVTGAEIGLAVDACWPGAPVRAYRADVGDLVDGDGTYTVAGVGSSANDAFGASLVVVFSRPSSPVHGAVVIDDGAMTVSDGAVTHAFGDLWVPSAPTVARLHVGVGDGQADLGEDPMTFGGQDVTAPDAFVGSDGARWDDLTLDVDLPAGTTQATNVLSSSSDCLAWTYAALEFQLAPSPVIVDNGTIQLGVNPQGHLNVPGGTASLGGTTDVGLRYLPTGGEATSQGCLCEGWGAADASTGLRGYANVSQGNPVNVSVRSFLSAPDAARSVVDIASGTGTGSSGTLRVTHDYHPSPATPNLFEVDVTIENRTDAPVEPRYRRVMDWDVEPTPFDEFVTVEAGTADVAFSSNDGFASADPLAPPSDIGHTGTFHDAGPDDHGALFDFAFGTLDPGGSVGFRIFYGAAASEEDAEQALVAVEAEAYSLGQPNTDADGVPVVESGNPPAPGVGAPNTFVFAFAGVGGDPVTPVDRIEVTPSHASTEAGAPVRFSSEGFDGSGASIGPVDAVYTIAPDPGGTGSDDGASCDDADCSATAAGDYTVTATFGGASDTATLEVHAGPPARLDVLPPSATVPAGGSQSYTVEGYDAFGNPLGDRSSVASFAITPDGSCSANTCTATVPGTHDVNVTDGDATGHAFLVVEEPPSRPPAEQPSVQTTNGSTMTSPDGTPIVAIPRAHATDLEVEVELDCPTGAASDATLVLNNATYPMTSAGGDLWTATIPADELETGDLRVIWRCPGGPQQATLAEIVLYDPRGILTHSVVQSQGIAGAEVVLYRVPSYTVETVPDDDPTTCQTPATQPDGGYDQPPPSDPDLVERLDPRSPLIFPNVNPFISNAIGFYGWDVARGCYFVVAHKPGYETVTSPMVGVPPEVFDLNLSMVPNEDPPAVEFLSPVPGTTYLLGTPIPAGTEDPVVVGTTTVEARVAAPPSGVDVFTFLVDGVAVDASLVRYDPGRGVYAFDYTPTPGRHTIEAVATSGVLLDGRASVTVTAPL